MPGFGYLPFESCDKSSVFGRSGHLAAQWFVGSEDCRVAWIIESRANKLQRGNCENFQFDSCEPQELLPQKAKVGLTQHCDENLLISLYLQTRNERQIASLLNTLDLKTNNPRLSGKYHRLWVVHLWTQDWDLAIISQSFLIMNIPHQAVL